MLRVTKKMRKRIIGVGATALAVVIAGEVILSSTQSAYAANATLPGIEETVQNHSGNNKPFVILEVVPNKADASLGLLIGGEEPINDDAKSIKDMPSADERVAHFGTETLTSNPDAKPPFVGKIERLDIAGALTFEDYEEEDVANPAKSLEIRGTFYVAEDGDYNRKDENELYQKITFALDGNNEPDSELIGDADFDELVEVNQLGLDLYRQHRSYRLPEEEKEDGTYAFNLKEIPADELDTFMPIELENNVYNNQFFVSTEITEDTVLEVGDMIFEYVVTETPADGDGAGGDGEGGDGTGEGTGDGGEGNGNEGGEGNQQVIEEVTLQYAIVADAGTDVEDYIDPDGASKYVIVEEADGNNIDDDEQYYYISEIRPDAGILVEEEEYVVVDRPDGGYQETVTADPENPDAQVDYVFLGKTYYIYNTQMPYAYDSNAGNYNFTADYTQPVYEVARYNGGITNNEWFKRYVFDRTTPEEFANLSIDVVTVTYEELAEKLQPNADGTPSTFLENVGLLYFGGCIHGLTLDDDKYVAEHNDSAATDVNNASFDATRMLFDAVEDGMPTIMNRSVYEAENNSYLVRAFAAAVMQPDISQVDSDAIFPENVQENFDQNQWATLFTNLGNSRVQPLNNGSLTYVREHLYVHDDVYARANNRPYYVVSSQFTTEFTDAEITGRQVTIDGEQVNLGFQEVLEEIETENFYLENAGVDERIDEVATVATAIRHILNHGQRRNVTKSTLSVLDLEPADFEKYYLYDVIDFEEREAGADGIKDVYQDIHIRNEDVDESIDVDTIQTDSICINEDGELDYTGWLLENLVDPNMDPNAIEVEIVGTREFIGRIDDLNEKYDLIYLGMDTSIMNTNIEGNHKTDVTDYNDTELHGLVYTHIGDSFQVTHGGNALDGIYRQSGNDITPDKRRALQEYIEAGYAVLLSDEMLRYDDEGELEVNDDKIDSSSNMYQLLDEVVLAQDDGEYLYFGKNVNVKNTILTNADAKTTFNSYLNISKLRLEYEEEDLPLAWSNPNPDDLLNGEYEPVYLEPDANGIYHLDFEIELINDAAVGVAESDYNCQLYIDVDADGRFDPDENLTGLTIYNGDDEVTIGRDERFHLDADETYEISRELPESYTGFISWKLVFTQNDVTYDYDTGDINTEDSVVRTSVSGFSAVPAPEDQKPTINILQITTDDSLNPGNENDNLNLDSDTMRALYANVQDFDIHVTRISSRRFIDKNPGGNGHEQDDDADDDDIFYANINETYIDYLNRFDMIVLGFDDEYNIGNGVGRDQIGGNGRQVTEQDVVDAMLAIREYTLSGRSVMFTHDLSSQRIEFDNNNNPNDTDYGWRGKGWYANRILRDIQGMDRYGWMNREWGEYALLAGIDIEDPAYYYDTVYDEPTLDGSIANIEEDYDSPYVGFTDPLVGNRNYKGDNEDNFEQWIGGNARNAAWYYELVMHYSVDEDEMVLGDADAREGTTTIAQVNSGQITEYPYQIPKEFEATFTHPQYMQLNLETDSSDERDDDIVVWYTLSDSKDDTDSYYRAYEKDVRNNYFIYNKGNVTYTGSGDTWNEDNLVEMQLFVNTLVASYRTGVHAPRATFKESELLSSATIDNMYIPYDPAMEDTADDTDGSFLENRLTVFFYTSNVDLQQSNQPIGARYYVLADNAEETTVTINGVAYKEVFPTLQRMMNNDGTLTPVAVADPSVLANNTMYVASFAYADIDFGRNAATGLREKNATDIYVRLGYGNMVNTGEIATSASENINGLHVMSTQLFELR